MNYVADLTVTAGAVECTATGYARVALARSAVAEDDVNNRANLPVSADPTWATLGGATNQQIIGHFMFTEGAGSDTTRPLWVVRWYDPTDYHTTTGAAFSIHMSIPMRLAVV